MNPLHGFRAQFIVCVAARHGIAGGAPIEESGLKRLKRRHIAVNADFAANARLDGTVVRQL